MIAPNHKGYPPPIFPFQKSADRENLEPIIIYSPLIITIIPTIMPAKKTPMKAPMYTCIHKNAMTHANANQKTINPEIFLGFTCRDNQEY